MKPEEHVVGYCKGCEKEIKHGEEYTFEDSQIFHKKCIPFMRKDNLVKEDEIEYFLDNYKDKEH